MPATRQVLIDTSYLVALLDPADDLNTRARDLAVELSASRARVVTTDAVLIELANYFSRSPLRGSAATWIAAIRGDVRWDVVPVEPGVLSAAERRYRRYADKTWSLTDCISMEVMRQRRIHEVATADRGFGQAGFTPASDLSPRTA